MMQSAFAGKPCDLSAVVAPDKPDHARTAFTRIVRRHELWPRPGYAAGPCASRSDAHQRVRRTHAWDTGRDLGSACDAAMGATTADRYHSRPRLGTWRRRAESRAVGVDAKSCMPDVSRRHTGHLDTRRNPCSRRTRLHDDIRSPYGTRGTAVRYIRIDKGGSTAASAPPSPAQSYLGT